MLDYSNILAITNHQTFFALGSTTWQTWQKPKNTHFVYITAIGGGAGGGSSSDVLGTSGGGGGGGSSSITSIMIPSALLPDTLYIQVGLGGSGGSGATIGASGELSTISIQPNTTAINTIIRSGAAAAVGGGVGNTTVGGAGGAGGTVFTSTLGLLSSLGFYSSISGDAGATGGYGANGLTKTALSNMCFCGGGGGAGKTTGTDFAGGSILAGGVLARVAGGSAGVAASNGNGGIATIRPNLIAYASSALPFATTGGSGGGANQNGTGGGNGGAGEIGSGGGGAGALNGGTGRVGGRGGDGLVIITCF